MRAGGRRDGGSGPTLSVIEGASKHRGVFHCGGRCALGEICTIVIETEGPQFGESD